MLEILRKFFAFCGEAERRKFYRSIALGVAAALFSAGKLPAIGITLRAMLAGLGLYALLNQIGRAHV